MKILKIYLVYNGTVENRALHWLPITSDELVHRCFGGDVRTLWKAARDEIPADHL